MILSSFTLFIIVSPIIAYITQFIRKLNNVIYFQLTLSCLVFISCLISMGENSEPHYLIGMTSFQELILFICGVAYVYDMTDHIHGLNEGYTEYNTFFELLHNLPAYSGILYMLYIKQGGGIIVRLLLDSGVDVVMLLQKLMNERYYHILDDIEMICFIGCCVIWYSFLSVYGIFVMMSYWNYVDKSLFIMYCAWTICVLYYHNYYCLIQTRKYRLKNMYYKYRTYLRGKLNFTPDKEEEYYIQTLKKNDYRNKKIPKVKKKTKKKAATLTGKQLLKIENEQKENDYLKQIQEQQVHLQQQEQLLKVQQEQYLLDQKKREIQEQQEQYLKHQQRDNQQVQRTYATRSKFHDNVHQQEDIKPQKKYSNYQNQKRNDMDLTLLKCCLLKLTNDQIYEMATQPLLPWKTSLFSLLRSEPQGSILFTRTKYLLETIHNKQLLQINEIMQLCQRNGKSRYEILMNGFFVSDEKIFSRILMPEVTLVFTFLDERDNQFLFMTNGEKGNDFIQKGNDVLLKRPLESFAKSTDGNWDAVELNNYSKALKITKYKSFTLFESIGIGKEMKIYDKHKTYQYGFNAKSLMAIILY
ncbi:hypothetical protein QTN25_003587 [Entamoeba marina]